jgi:hypothetical membrane protein
VDTGIVLVKAWNWLVTRATSILVFGGIQYLVLSTIAMALYPGGTKYNNLTIGYLFWNNMLSDMGRTVAHNGTSNLVSCALFIMTMCLLAFAFVPFYVELTKQFTSTQRCMKYARVAGLLGIITGSLLALSASFPQDLFPQLHLRLAQASFVALAPSMIVYWWLVRGNRGFPRPCAPALLAFAIIILAGIMVTIASGTGIDAVTVTVQATTQKVMVYSWNVLIPIEAWGLWKKTNRKTGAEIA